MIAIATPKNQQKQTEGEQKITFEQFLKIYPEYGHYELIDGELIEIFEMAFTRNHDDVGEFIDRRFYREVERLALNYVIKRAVPIRSIDQSGNERGRVPDVSVIDATSWRSNRSDYKGFGDKIQLAVEVVSTNWEDDYVDKFEEYQRIGISEYWIVDYLAIASREFLGNPKIPTVFVNLLDEKGKYQTTKFIGDDKINSRTFPELDLTAAQILNI
ncbi:Uma2 family endonuclease [Pseudanabaena sp. FACHB-1998]|uniref:Uma2 family endonuclease n=1 Tax=Pseudanabaena sp. FACHB-1998 TaxID=2692858 RepID=UPI0016818A36|nr:Uma2 family endonuclease [Pseudanabaena sp. FACHB-1998]MBD2176322.1 Uma2 family endonuclease [Pseudanabaena sp. FACHB-1998]